MLANFLRLPLLVAGLLASLGECLAQTAQLDNAAPNPQPAAEQGLSDASRLAELDAFISQARTQWGVPGLAVAIVKDGQVVLAKGYGVRQVDQPEAVDAETLFAIASNTKAFTAAGLAILVDEGKLSWDDRVHDYLPWFQLSDPLATADLRVKDLLCHRSGLGTFSGDLLWWGTSYTPRELLERARQLPPAGPFRAHYGYSNLMFLAAGEMIQVVSGQTWAEFTQSRLLSPVGMNRSLVSTTQLANVDNVATPHKTLSDASVVLEWMNWDSMAAAGGVISSANDMSRWLLVQLSQGELASGEPLFSPDQAHEMWQPQMIIPISRSASGRAPSTHFKAYGLGWSLSDYHGRKLVGHGGGYDGMYSRVLMVPQEQLGVVVLTNSMTGITNTLAYGIVDSYLQNASLAELEKRSAKQLADFRSSRRRFDERIAQSVVVQEAGKNKLRPLDDYVADFVCPMFGDATVTREDDGLVLRLLPNPQLVADLEPMHFNTFRIRWRNTYAWFSDGNVHFVDDKNGKFQRLELDVPNDDMWFYELNFSRQK